MGFDKARLEVGGVAQAARIAGVAGALAGRVVEVGGSSAGVERVADTGEGPHNAILLAVRELGLPRGELVVVLPVDLYALEASGLSWLVREVYRYPGLVMGSDRPNYAVFGAAAGYLARDPRPRSLREMAGGLRRLVPPAGLADQFSDADTRDELDRIVRRNQAGAS